MAGFFSGGGASLTFGDTRDPNSFPQYGNRWRGGQIIEIGDVMPQTDMKTKEPIIRNGKVAEQLPVTLLCDGSGPAAQAGMQTDERNRNDHTDTGRRTVYVKGSLRYAMGDALRAVGAEDIDPGGYLYMMWTGMGKSGNSDFIGRTWQVHYIRPSGAFLQQQTTAANPMQSAPPQQGAMPMQQNAQGQYAPQHTGFAPTQQPVTAPPNPYAGGVPVPPQAPPVGQWGAQQGQYPADQHTAAAQMVGAQPPAASQGTAHGFGHNPPQSPGGQAWAAEQQTPAVPPQSAAPAGNPWGQAQETTQQPQAPYGPPQGAPGSPAPGNPWNQ